MKNKFDIVTLIEKNSITRLNKDYKNKLINKIKDNFTNNEQQLFLTSFYCYLNYDTIKDFIIDFDNVWKWCGFSRKSDGKRVLDKHFVNEADYIILRQPPQNSKEGGRPVEKITLTVNTFKKFCLKANTKKADEIHDYYIKLENILHETINDQTNELQNQLKNTNTKLILKQKELSEKESEIINIKKKLYERQRHKYTEGSSIYIIMNNDIKDKFKFGETKTINSRLTQLNSGAPSPYFVHKLWYTRMAKKTERIVHDIFDKYRISKDCEWFDNEILNKVIDFVDKIINLYENYDTVKIIKKKETIQYAKLIFIEDNLKQCTKCLLYKNCNEFYIRDIYFEEPEVFSSEKEKEEFYSKKYRSHCKKCNNKTNSERKKLLKQNPTIGKKECTSCEELLDYQCFFDNEEDCIDCYKNKNNIKDYCKQCNKCKKILFSKDFHSDINKLDGLHTICKVCRNNNEKKIRKQKETVEIECEYCKKIIKGLHNLKNHQKTISCLKYQNLKNKTNLT